jgi:hypothetical protein
MFTLTAHRRCGNGTCFIPHPMCTPTCRLEVCKSTASTTPTPLFDSLCPHVSLATHTHTATVQNPRNQVTGKVATLQRPHSRLQPLPVCKKTLALSWRTGGLCCSQATTHPHMRHVMHTQNAAPAQTWVQLLKQDGFESAGKAGMSTDAAHARKAQDPFKTPNIQTPNHCTATAAQQVRLPPQKATPLPSKFKSAISQGTVRTTVQATLGGTGVEGRSRPRAALSSGTHVEHPEGTDRNVTGT